MRDDEGNPWPTPSKQDLLAVASLADELDREPAAKFSDTTTDQPGVIRMPYVEYGPTMDRLHKLVYDAGLVVSFDWGAWQDEGVKYFDDPAALAQADLVTIQKLITLHFRKERFSEGHLDHMHTCGHLAAICRRLGELAEAD